MFYIKEERNRITKSLLYAVVDKNLTDESKLYHYPYGNVYRDGRICWGSNSLPQISSLADFERVINLFFGAKTNNDLYEPPKVKHEEHEYAPSQLELISLMEREDEFPEKFLKTARGKLGEL